MELRSIYLQEGGKQLPSDGIVYGFGKSRYFKELRWKYEGGVLWKTVLNDLKICNNMIMEYLIYILICPVQGESTV